MSKSDIGVYGLGVMGSNLALNMLDNGFSLSVFNRDVGDEKGTISAFLNDNSQYQSLSGFTDEKEFIASIERPRKILMMVKAGPVIDQVIEHLLPHLEEGDILIDGGNSHYKDTERRVNHLGSHNIHFLGVGISGGQKGARNGPSLMPGGDSNAYKQVAPILTSIAAKDSFEKPCCTHIGENGAGHFVKMVHNGIEYVEMQLLAELFSILKRNHTNEEISSIFSNWNSGELESYLLEITSNILLHKNEQGFLVDQILDAAGSKGTGSWSTIASLETGAVTTMMASSVFARYISSKKDQRVSLSIEVDIPSTGGLPLEIEKLKSAYRTARILNHYQGFELIRIAASDYNWDVDLSELARIWTNGCIIRSKLMEELSEVFKETDSLLDHSEILLSIQNSETDLSSIIKSGLDLRVPTPAFSSAHEFWISITSANLPANLIQAQRDYFGAHTYQLKGDSSGSFYHTNWEKND